MGKSCAVICLCMQFPFTDGGYDVAVTDKKLPRVVLGSSMEYFCMSSDSDTFAGLN